MFSATWHRVLPVWHRSRDAPDMVTPSLTLALTLPVQGGECVSQTRTSRLREVKICPCIELEESDRVTSKPRFPELPRRPTRQTAVRVTVKSPILALLRPATPSGSLVPLAPFVPSVPAREAVLPGARGLSVAVSSPHARASPTSLPTQA